MRIDAKIKSDNDKYTRECQKIFDSIKFAKIETERLITGRKVLLFLGMTITFFAVLVFVIVTWIANANTYKSSDYIGSIIFIVFSLLFIGGSIFGIIYYSRENRKDKESSTVYYYINDGSNAFQIVAREENDGKIYAKTLINFYNNKMLYMDNEGGEPDTCEHGKNAVMDFTGFYQYTITNEYKVLRHSYLNTSKIYKFKADKDNKTLYYFKKLAGAKGEPNPRSVSLVNGIVEKICVQESYNSYYNSDRHSKSNVSTKRMNYSHVNDSACKLYIHKQAYLDAVKLKFQMPKSENIVISEDK